MEGKRYYIAYKHDGQELYVLGWGWLARWFRSRPDISNCWPSFQGVSRGLGLLYVPGPVHSDDGTWVIREATLVGAE